MSEIRGMEWVEYTKVNEKVTREKERLLIEFGLSIIINGSHFATAIITPMMVKEFTVGYLFGQGMLESIGDIRSIEIKGNVAEISLPGIRDSSDLHGNIRSDFKVSSEDIFAGVNAILKSKIYAETEAIHSAGLFREGAEVICIAEDFGRHNALDKVIGYALIHDVDFKNTFATSTGRMVSDMVSKICRANIPVVATKTAVTKLGVDLGNSCGLTIIGFVRDAGSNVNADTGAEAAKREMKIYTNPERILY